MCPIFAFWHSCISMNRPVLLQEDRTLLRHCPPNSPIVGRCGICLGFLISVSDSFYQVYFIFLFNVVSTGFNFSSLDWAVPYLKCIQIIVSQLQENYIVQAFNLRVKIALLQAVLFHISDDNRNADAIWASKGNGKCTMTVFLKYVAHLITDIWWSWVMRLIISKIVFLYGMLFPGVREIISSLRALSLPS